MVGKILFAVVLIAAVVSAIDVKCETYLTDPRTSNTYYFNLTKLHHDDHSAIDNFWYRTEKNNIYYVNFCGQTASACSSRDVSVCLRSPSGSSYQYIDAGRTSTQTFSRSQGEETSKSVTVTYSDGAACSYGRNKKTNIVVKCQATANPGFIYDYHEDDDCEVTLFMYSASGCGKLSSGSSSSSSSEPSDFCSSVLTDPQTGRKYKYDLKPLYHDRHQYIDTLWFRTDDNSIYYINFCGQTASACVEDTSVCVRIPTGEDYKYISGGSTSTQQFSLSKKDKASDSITVTYSNGEECGNGRKRKTNVVVRCQKSAKPGYIYDFEEIDECESTLYMWSVYGCGEEI